MPIALAFGDIALIAAAGIALVMLLAMRTLAVPVGQWLAHSVPLIGGAIGGGLEAGVAYAVHLSQGWLDWALTPLIAVTLWVSHNLGPVLGQIGQTFQSTANEIWHLRYNVIGAVRADYQLVIGVVAYNLQSNINAVDNAGQALTHSLFATAEADITSGVASAVKYAEQVAGSALATAEAGIATAEALAAADVSQLAAVVAQDEQALQALLSGGLAGAEANIAQALAQAQAFATQEVTSVRDWAQQQEGALSQALTSTLTMGIAGVAAEVATVAEELTQFRQNCGDPICNNLGSFGQDIAALSGLMGEGLLFALVAAAVADPHGVAVAVDDVFSPVATALKDGLQAVVGLAA